MKIKIKYLWWDFVSFWTSQLDLVFAACAILVITDICLFILAVTQPEHHGTLYGIMMFASILIGLGIYLMVANLGSDVTEKTAWRKLDRVHVAKFKSDKKVNFRIIQSVDDKGKIYWKVQALITKIDKKPVYPFLHSMSYMDGRIYDKEIRPSWGGMSMKEIRDQIFLRGLGHNDLRVYNHEEEIADTVTLIKEMNIHRGESDFEEYFERAQKAMARLNTEDVISVRQILKSIRETEGFSIDLDEQTLDYKESWNDMSGISAAKNEPYTYRDSTRFYSKNFARYTLAWYATALEEKPKPKEMVVQENWDSIIPEVANPEDDWSDF